MKKILARLKPLSTSLLVLLAVATCSARAATTIENDRYKVDIEAGDGTFTMAFKPSGKTILTAGKLSGKGGTAKTVALGDAWKEVARGATIGANKQITFAPVKAQLVRINVLKAERAININEFSVFEK